MPKITDFAPSPPELREGEDYSVFLSYRSVNRLWVIELYDALMAAGHKVFLDQFELVPGRKLSDSLESALGGSRAGVLVWSSAAKDSDWVQLEYNRMLERQKYDKSFYFVVVVLDDAELPGPIDGRIFLDFKDYPDGPNGSELLRLLHGVVGKPFDGDSARLAAAITEDLKNRTLDIATAVEMGSSKRLLKLAELRDDVWEYSSQVGSLIAEGLIKLGENEAALDYLKNLEAEFPKSLRPKQLMAHVQTRINTEDSVEEAQWILHRLYNEKHRDAETLGLYGKVLYTQHLASGGDRASRDTQLLRRSRNFYREGFENSSDDTYCGINAATKTLILGEATAKEEAAEIASEILNRLPEANNESYDYWQLATIGEAKLIEGNIAEAATAYQRAVDRSPGETGSHASTYGSVRDLCEVMGLAPEERAVLETPFSHVNG